jgi:hypothetical protein
LTIASSGSSTKSASSIKITCCSSLSGAGGAAPRTVHGSVSSSGSGRCRRGCARRLGCARGWRVWWRTGGISPRSRPRTGCRAHGAAGAGGLRRAGGCRGRAQDGVGMDETRFGRPQWLPDGVHHDGRVPGIYR